MKKIQSCVSFSIFVFSVKINSIWITLNFHQILLFISPENIRKAHFLKISENHWFSNVSMVLEMEHVLKMGFPGAYLCMGVILMKLQSDFVEIAILCWCSPVGLLHVWEHHPWRTPLEDCFWTDIILYSVFNLFFLMKYTFENFKISVLLSF